MRIAALTFAGALLLAGPVAALARGGNSLAVTYWPKGASGRPTVWTLKCAPAAGTHPQPRRACRDLAAHAADLAPATRACTLMPTLSSPRATLVGTWRGRRIRRAYRQGCPGWSDLRFVLTGK